MNKVILVCLFILAVRADYAILNDVCCDSGQYLDSAGACLPCATYCSSCMYSNMDHTNVADTGCVPVLANCASQTVDNVCATCSSGYRVSTDTATNGTCVACASGCSVCTATACTTCMNQADGTTPKNKITADMTCVDHLSNCTTMDSGVNTCQVCATGYHRGTTGASCTACPTNCSSCTSATDCGANCTTVSGYETQGTCQACPSNCTGCTTSTTCQTCASGYALLNNASCTACSTLSPTPTNSGQVSTCAYDTASPPVLGLTGCSGAFAHYSGNCVSCPAGTTSAGCATTDGSAFTGVTCEAVGYFGDSGSTTCTACINTYCTTCTAADACTDCTAPTGLTGSPEVCAICTDSTSANANVHTCISNDAADKGKIRYCNDGFGGILGTHTMTSGNGGLLNYTNCNVTCGTGCKRCQLAAGATATATTDTTCTVCTAWSSETANAVTTTRGAYISTATPAYTCVDCISANCYSCSSTACLACMSGYYIVGTGCTACVANCTTCTASTCSQCATNMTGDGTECHTTQLAADCTTGQWYNTASTSLQCVACTNYCNVCTTATDCQTCRDGYGWVSPACVACTLTVDGIQRCDGNAAQVSACMTGYVLASTNLTCTACIANCKMCATNATLCDDQQCMDGYKQNEAMSTCLACATGCKSCSSTCIKACHTCWDEPTQSTTSDCSCGDNKTFNTTTNLCETVVQPTPSTSSSDSSSSSGSVLKIAISAIVLCLCLLI